MMTVGFSLEPIQVQLSLETLVRLLLEELGNHFLHKQLWIMNLEMLSIRKPRHNLCLTTLLDFL
jgi:hypothetical protein